MEKYREKSHEEIVSEVDARVKKICNELTAEGYKFELEIPNASMIILKVGGKEINFTKKERYDFRDKNGNPIDDKKIEDVIADRIRELG